MFLEIVILRIQDSEVIGMIFKEWKYSSSSSSNGQMLGREHQWWCFTSEAGPHWQDPGCLSRTAKDIV